MEVTARLKRAVSLLGVAVIAAAICACSLNTTARRTDSGVGTAADLQGQTQVSAADISGAPRLIPGLISTSLNEFGSPNLGATLVSAAQFDRLVIASQVSPNDCKISTLSEPNRLVLDIMSPETRLNQVFSTDKSNLVSQVRIGAHPDKTRIVLDLKGDTLPETSLDPIDGKLVLTLANSGQLNVALNAPIVGGAATTDLDRNLDGNSAMAELSTEKLAEVEAAPAPAMPESEKPAVAVAAADTTAMETKTIETKLTGISLEPVVGGSAALIAELNQETSFNLKKTAPSEYVLTLNRTALDERAATTILAPPGQNGAPRIRSVRPVVKDNDVQLRIFAAPEVNLSASQSGNKILVSASSIEPSSDGRAQMAEEKADGKTGASEAAASPTKEGAVTVSDKVDAAPDGAVGDELSALLSDTPKYSGRLISLDLQDTDIDNALRIIAEVSNLNIIASEDVAGKVTLRLIDVPWDQALDVILKTNNLDKVQEGNVIRIAPVDKLKQEREALKQAQQAEEELEPLSVRYVRISYAKASELKPLVESVITERGTVAYDERTNQLIVKDTRRGVKNVAQLIGKVDLRTPQVLLETQIVEAQRSLARDLGSQLGFKMVRAPEYGNATGYNFPNSISVGGSLVPGKNTGSSFPAAIGATGGSAVDILLGSADGTIGLDTRISALENEGRIRVVSRPSVATTNNRSAVIKSVEKVRVKMPDGGTSVNTAPGSGNGGSNSATEVIEIGITLEVTPQASPDFYVLLDIKAKSSTFGSHVVEGIPSEVERSANSTVLVSSGQTFAMGGIYKIADKDAVTGVPFFKDIPFIGHLFRRANVDNTDEELIFFVTPRIVEGSFDDAAMKAAS